MGIYIGNMYWQISYLLLAAAFIFTIVAQRRVSGQYARYASVACQKGISGSQAARMILDAHGLQDVSIGLTGGRLTDHYDPRKNTMALSNEVYNDCSISSVAVAAHECGHAIQEAEGYTFLKIDRISRRRPLGPCDCRAYNYRRSGFLCEYGDNHKEIVQEILSAYEDSTFDNSVPHCKRDGAPDDN